MVLFLLITFLFTLGSQLTITILLGVVFGIVTLLFVLIIIVFVTYKHNFGRCLQNELIINRTLNGSTSHILQRQLETETVFDISGLDNDQYLTVRTHQPIPDKNELNLITNYEDIESLVREQNSTNVNNGPNVTTYENPTEIETDVETDTLSVEPVYEDIESIVRIQDNIFLNNGQYLTAVERPTEIRGNTQAKSMTFDLGDEGNAIRLNNGQYLTVMGTPTEVGANAYVEPITIQSNFENDESTMWIPNVISLSNGQYLTVMGKPEDDFNVKPIAVKSKYDDIETVVRVPTHIYSDDGQYLRVLTNTRKVKTYNVKTESYIAKSVGEDTESTSKSPSLMRLKNGQYVMLIGKPNEIGGYAYA